MTDLEHARQLLAGAQNIAVLTGAGISAESGIPTFRGPGGLWRNFRPEDLATPKAFAKDPALVWEWYMWRRSLIAQAQPNPGHLALVELVGRHERAGRLVVRDRFRHAGLVQQLFAESDEELANLGRGAG